MKINLIKSRNSFFLTWRTCLLLLIILPSCIYAQTPNQNLTLSHQSHQRFYKQLYNTQTSFHSAIRPLFSDDSLLTQKFDSLSHAAISERKTTWLGRKLFQEHLIEIRKPDYSINIDFIPDLQVGREFNQSKSTFQNTRAYQIEGTIGTKFSFYTRGYENQAVFANYIQEFVSANQVVPGQNFGKFGQKIKDWNNVSSILSYTPNKYLNMALGYDKNFIGDGYRSMLLSDAAGNYTFFRLRGNLGQVSYQAVYAYLADPGAERLTDDRRLGDRKKWGVFHYIDWNVNNRLSVGFFEAITWADAEEEGKRGFDFNYIHPFVFLRPIENANSSSPDKVRLGLNLKYEISSRMTTYGQFMIDEFTAKEFFKRNGYWANKWALQLGFRGTEAFKVPDLNYLFEFNTARPYTYAHFNRLSNYSHYNQPLAHPFGANFREFISLWNYRHKKFDFQLEMLYAQYGLDGNGQNFGKNIFLDYNTRNQDYENYIGQGISTQLYFTETKVSYTINPKYNLRLEASAIFRNENNSLGTQRTTWLNIGLRSLLISQYYDF